MLKTHPFSKSIVDVDAFKYCGSTVHSSDELHLRRFRRDDQTAYGVTFDASQHRHKIAFDQKYSAEID
jgi:hypothetical protein